MDVSYSKISSSLKWEFPSINDANLKEIWSTNWYWQTFVTLECLNKQECHERKMLTVITRYFYYKVLDFLQGHGTIKVC